MEGSALKLIVEKGPREGETIDCRPGSVIRIGRVVKGNTFTIKDAGISSKHLLIEYKDGKWVVSDLESSNGSLLNNVQLRPMMPFDLRDGDVIKVGEYTSMKVKIAEEVKADDGFRKTRNRAAAQVVEELGEENGENQFRRNTRRGAALKNARAPKGEPSESATVSVSRVQKIPGRSKSKVENCLEPEILAPVAENRGRRAPARRTRASKNEPLESSEVLEARDKSNLGLGSSREPENEATVAENRTRQGASKKTRASKNEPAQSASEVRKINESSKLDRQNCRELENAETVEEKQKQKRRVAAKRTRASKNDEPSDSVAVSEVQRIPESSNLGQESCREPANEVPVEEKQTGKVAKEKCPASQGEALDSVSVPVSEAQRGGFKIRKDTCKESTSTSAVKENSVKVDLGKELEKMTLGEWFDYLEVYLPKQIYEATEEMFSRMRERTKQFNEFMSQQQKGKTK